MYKYNSYHKIITVGLIVVWAAFHFSRRENKGLYHQNGQAKISGEKVNSLNEGEWIWYYENGTVQMTGHFKTGKRIGEWRIYNPDGVLVSVSHYENDALNGLQTNYDVAGNITSQMNYKNDVPVKEKPLPIK